MRLAVPCRTTVPGAELRLLVLASSRRGLIGVDLDSGAFVRAHHPDRDALAPFEVVTGRIAEGEPFVSPHEPEAADLADAPQRVGRLTGRRAERYLRPLLHPSGTHLMGFPTPTVPYWTLEGDRPSVALLQPDAGPAVKQTPAGFLCRFAWRGADHDLPLDDAVAVQRLERSGATRFTSGDLCRWLGFRPHLMLVAFSPPHHGNCYKVVAALLPRP